MVILLVSLLVMMSEYEKIMETVSSVIVRLLSQERAIDELPNASEKCYTLQSHFYKDSEGCCDKETTLVILSRFVATVS